jgi:hypothetical protein
MMAEFKELRDMERERDKLRAEVEELKERIEVGQNLRFKLRDEVERLHKVVGEHAADKAAWREMMAAQSDQGNWAELKRLLGVSIETAKSTGMGANVARGYEGCLRLMEIIERGE